jgi:hypothetical protein
MICAGCKHDSERHVKGGHCVGDGPMSCRCTQITVALKDLPRGAFHGPGGILSGHDPKPRPIDIVDLLMAIKPIGFRWRNSDGDNPQLDFDYDEFNPG